MPISREARYLCVNDFGKTLTITDWADNTVEAHGELVGLGGWKLTNREDGRVSKLMQLLIEDADGQVTTHPVLPDETVTVSGPMIGEPTPPASSMPSFQAGTLG